MKKRAGYAPRRLCAVLCLICILCSAVSLSAAEANAAGTVTGSFFAFGHTIYLDYAYSEDFFRQPSDVYSHDLARLSLGLAAAAFRDEDKPEEQDDHLIAFFKTLGFDRIETDTYHTVPTAYSIGYGLARLELEDMTVIAMAVCGGGYGAEWTSNLTVGDSVRPEGFQDAAQKVQAALKDYMERYPAEGDAKLWITGYSRAGAVSNLTAADCAEWGVFKDIYAYTFATPRTTKEPGGYSHIFNILQKNDLVPKIPLADWGYERYGTDLYLASAEIDMERTALFGRAGELYRDMVGAEMVTNFEINYQLRIVLDYLYMLVQDSAAYTQYLQPLILDIMTQDDGTMDALQILLEALQSFSLEDEQHGDELKAMRDYLGTLINIYYLQDGIGQLPADQWDPQFGTVNLFNEHLPFEYLAMMFASDDPEEVFSENTRYLRLVIYGKTDTEIRDGDTLLKTVLVNGKEMVDGREDPESPPDVDYSSEKTVITLPADRSFRISIKSKAFLPQTVTYTGLLFSGDTVRAEADDLYSYLMSNGGTATIITSSNGRAIEPESSDHTDVSAYIDTIYSPTTAMRLENNSVMHLTISGLVNKILFILVLLLIGGIVAIVLAVIRKKKHRKRNTLVALIWHCVIAAVFTVFELAMWYFVPILPLAKLIPAILVFLTIIIYAHKGYRVNKKRIKGFLIITGALAVFDIVESLIIGDFAIWKCILMLVVYAGFMLAAYHFLWKGNKEDAPAQA